MSAVVREEPDVVERRAVPVPWLTLLVLAALMAYADGFVVTVTEGAVGAMGSNDSPFARWLRDSTLVLPVFLFAVYRSLVFSGRRYGPGLRRPRAVLGTALLVVAVGSLIGVAEVAASGYANYSLQAEQLRATQSVHGHATLAAGAEDADACTGLCSSLHASAAAQVRAAEYASPLLVVANVVLVGWVVAARGGRLEPVPLRRRGPRTPRAT